MDLEMWRGDTPMWNLQVTRAGQPFDLTDWDVYFTAKKFVTDADPGVFQLAIDAGLTVLDAANGLVKVQPPRGATNTLPDTDHQLIYDIQVSNETTEETYTLLRGKLSVKVDVTEVA